MPDTQVLSDGTLSYATERGTIAVTPLAPGLLLLMVSGYMTIEHYARVIDRFTQEVERHGKLTFFVDGETFENYESAFREAWQNWLKRFRQHIVEVPMLCRSPIVKMGLQVVNLATGGPLTAISSRDVFTARVRQDFPAYQEPVVRSRLA